MDIEKYYEYIGRIIKYENEFRSVAGCAFLIDTNTVITAQHIFRSKGEIVEYYLEIGSEYIPIYMDKIKVVDDLDLAVINCNGKFKRELNPPYMMNASKLFDDETSKWEILGYREEKQITINGIGIRTQIDKEKLLLNVLQSHSDIFGVSGSPVFVNGMISGVAIRQQTKTDGNGVSMVNSVIILPLSVAKGFIPLHRINKGIFNNRNFKRIEYSNRIDGYSSDNYMERLCTPLDSEDEFGREKKSLKEMIFSEDRLNRNIVLVGNAGIGKTFELVNTAVEFKETGKFYPLYFPLEELSDFSEIENLVKDYDDNNVPYCLFLDGLDDIKDKNIYQQFNRKFSGFAENYTGTESLIVISVRTDFFRKSSFHNFFELELCELSGEQIKEACAENNVSGDAFLTEAERKGVLENVSYPFYLFKLIDIFIDRGTLPQKHQLMEAIIDYALEKCYEENRDLGEDLAAKNNVDIKNSLSKLALAFFHLGGNRMDDGVYNKVLSDGKIREKNSINLCGLVTNKNGNRFFVHNNFYEYLTARELNKRFPDNIEGVKELLCDSCGNLLPENINILAFLVPMRKSDDLISWLIKNNADNIKLFESDKLSVEELTEYFKRIFNSLTVDGMRAEIHGSADIEKWAKNTDCIAFLIDRYQNSDDEIEKSNAAYLLSLRDDVSDFDDEIKEIAVKIFESDIEDVRLLKNTVNLLAELKVDDGMCDIVMERLGGRDEEIIIDYLCKYLTVVQRADDYIDEIFDMIWKCRRNRYMSFAVVESVSSFRRLESYISFLKYVLDNHRDLRGYYAYNRFFNNEFTDVFSAAYIEGDNKDEARQLFERLMVCSYPEYIKSGIMNFFSKANCENIAIEELFEITCGRAYDFVGITQGFSCFADFIKSKYENGFFADDSKNLITYMSYIKDDNPVKEELLDYLRGYDENYAKSVVDYFDNKSNSQNELKRLRIEYIFNYQRLKEDIHNLIKSQGKDDVTYSEYNHIIYDKIGLNNAEYTAFSLVVTYLKYDVSVLKSLESVDEDEFFIREFVSLLDEYPNDYELITEEQFHIVKTFCEDFVNNNDFESSFEYRNNGYTILINTDILTAVMKLIIKYDFAFSKEKLFNMLFIPTFYFDEGNSISEYLTKKLTADEISEWIQQIAKTDDFRGDLAEKSLIYCAEHKKKIPELFDKAVELLKEGTAAFICPKAFEYLIEIGCERRIVNLAISNKIKPRVVINNLYKIKDGGLNEYCGILFDNYYVLREKLLAGEDYVQLAADNDDLVESDFTNSAESVQGAIERDMRRLFEYLVEYNSERHIELYLDYMINEKRSCFLDQSEWQMQIGKIRSAKFTEKLFEIVKSIYSGEFEYSSSFSTLAGDIEKALFAIATKNRKLILDKIAELAASDIIEFRRAASEIKRRFLINVKVSHERTLEETIDFVFGNK